MLFVPQNTDGFAPDEFNTSPDRALDDYPEISTTAAWRVAMRTKREAREMNQDELGRRVGVSQNVISKMETGILRSSKAVLPICNVLRIPPPMALFEDELDQRWYDKGRQLRALAPGTFEMMLAAVEGALANLLEQAERERRGQ